MTKDERERWLKRQWPCVIWRLKSGEWCAESTGQVPSNGYYDWMDIGHGDSPGEAFLDLVRRIAGDPLGEAQARPKGRGVMESHESPQEAE